MTARPPGLALLPEDLRRLGAPRDPGHAFSKIQRACLGGGEAPGRELGAFLSTLDLAPPEIVSAHASLDGSTKLALRLGDGAVVEAVHMPRDVKTPRVTLCISSQVGCALGCTFCSTATMGLVRNLDAHEIAGQVHALVRELGPRDPSRINVVFMGMGEPLHNTDAVLRATRVLSCAQGLAISPGRVTVSTAGIVPEIERLAATPCRPSLALSLNATTDEARARTMPITRRWGIARLREALLAFPLRPKEKLTVAYVVLPGENDTDDDAERLAAFVQGFRHVVNLIPYNAFPGAPFAEGTEERLRAFSKILLDRGCLVTVRRSRGRDVAAACGQLVRARTGARARVSRSRARGAGG